MRSSFQSNFQYRETTFTCKKSDQLSKNLHSNNNLVQKQPPDSAWHTFAHLPIPLSIQHRRTSGCKICKGSLHRAPSHHSFATCSSIPLCIPWNGFCHSSRGMLEGALGGPSHGWKENGTTSTWNTPCNPSVSESRHSSSESREPQACSALPAGQKENRMPMEKMFKMNTNTAIPDLSCKEICTRCYHPEEKGRGQCIYRGKYI